MCPKRYVLVSVAVVTVFMLVFAAYSKVQHAEGHAHYREIGELMVANSLLKHHWQGLETNEEFRPIVQELCDSFTPDEFKWGSLRPAANHPEDDQKPSNDLERDLLKRWAGTRKPGDYLLQTTSTGIWFYKPIYMDRDNCVTCHRSFNRNVELKKGDLQGIIRVQLAANSEKPQAPGNGVE